MHRPLLVLGLSLLSFCSLLAQSTPPASLPTIGTFTTGMERNPGFLTFYWDARKGKIWLEIDKFDTELLYYPTLAQGIGSNDIGL
ncbi:MAG: DUF5118 domain-containing protein, partial [Cytophagaceae bacterium]